ncbi:MAG: hypothetical protein GYB56_02490 [Gammaproteobacteria bacterium]|nr:hypothetical protein [Gammaproteobacteria bacterium]MBR9798142.1 hypothetical protein [Gammaproteobacteria bacterium]
MLEEFREDLNKLSSVQVYRKYILGSDCYLFDSQELLDLKEAISNELEVSFEDIIIVGSGKLGFSIKPSKRFESFGDGSDIDIAIVSTSLFEKVWREAYLYKKSKAFWPEQQRFFGYLSSGWIRPDKLPKSSTFEFTNKWWSFFNQLTSSGDFGQYKIRAGLYHSGFFLQEYQTICIEECIQELE